MSSGFVKVLSAAAAIDEVSALEELFEQPAVPIITIDKRTAEKKDKVIVLIILHAVNQLLEFLCKIC